MQRSNDRFTIGGAVRAIVRFDNTRVRRVNDFNIWTSVYLFEEKLWVDVAHVISWFQFKLHDTRFIQVFFGITHAAHALPGFALSA
jgi:hypothetical protein